MILMALVLEETAQKAHRAQTPDEQLFATMADGQTDSLETVYQQTKSAVYGFALSILKNPQDAQDVMQDTYVTLYRKAASYRPQGKPMAWILTITRNLALMHLRRQKREAPLPEDIQSEAHFEETSLDKQVLNAALIILSDEERQIVILHCVSGLRHREIAELLDLPLGTVLSKYRRALAKLQRKLKEEAS